MAKQRKMDANDDDDIDEDEERDLFLNFYALTDNDWTIFNDFTLKLN